MLVCIGQTPGYSMSSQTTLRPHGFSRSFYVPLQLLLTAFVSPTLLDYRRSLMAARSRRGALAAPHSLTGTSRNVPRWNPCTEHQSQSALFHVFGCCSSCKSGLPGLAQWTQPLSQTPKSTKILKNYNNIIPHMIFSHTYWVVTRVLCPASVSYMKKANFWKTFLCCTSFWHTWQKEQIRFFLNQNYYCVATIRNNAKLTVIDPDWSFQALHGEQIFTVLGAV